MFYLHIVFLSICGCMMISFVFLFSTVVIFSACILAEVAMDSIIGYFGAKPVNQEKPIGIERTPSGTMKWVKELSPLGNNVVGRCARCESLTCFSMTFFFFMV